MSEKRNHSTAFSASSQSSSESPVLETTRKRWKSQQQHSTSQDIRPVLSPNGNLEATSAMTAVQDSIIDGLRSPTSKNHLVENDLIAKNSQKNIRYDRQLRLWGDHGQEFLESAHVCLLNASAIGTEVLKSLILPGVGAFTIFDGEVISGADVGANFFLESEFIGQSRSKVACDLLKELNPDVRGHHIDLSPEKAIAQHGYGVFDKFSIVVGTNLKRATMSTLGEYLFNRGIPFILCQSYGLIGYVRLLVKEHVIVESHPENPSPNFMLDQPFPELMQLVNSTDLESMNHKDHSHTPYLLLLFKALEEWRAKRNDAAAFPRAYKEKKEVKDILLSMRHPDDKGWLDEENFQEAVNAVNSAMTETVVPREVNQILNDEAAATLTTSSSNFWILCNALHRFVKELGRLPVRGVLPDMISDSERYVHLQNIFVRKAEEEAALIHSFAMEASKSLQRQIPLSEARLFCKNAPFLRVIRNSLSLNDKDEFGVADGAFVAELKEDGSLNALWYLILNVCSEFLGDHGRYPCSNDGRVDSDKMELIGRVEKTVVRLVGDAGKVPKLKDAVEEVARYGGAEVHAIASFVGGTAAQEVIKLITHQYVPLNNTFVFDGNTGQGTVFSL